MATANGAAWSWKNAGCLAVPYWVYFSGLSATAVCGRLAALLAVAAASAHLLGDGGDNGSKAVSIFGRTPPVIAKRRGKLGGRGGGEFLIGGEAVAGDYFGGNSNYYGSTTL